MEKENILTNIHRYLLGDMDENERHRFEEASSNNESIQSQIKMEQKFLNTLELTADAELRKSIATVHQKMKSSGILEQSSNEGAKIVQLKERKASRMLYAVAATLAIVVAAWFVTNNSTVDINNNNLFADYYSPEQTVTNIYLSNNGVAGLTGTPENLEDRLAIAIDQYANGSYELALRQLRAINTAFPADKTSQFYLALSHLQLGNAGEATALLTALDHPEADFNQTANWYLALSLLKETKVKDAQNILNDITRNPNHRYSQKAKDLLKDMN